MVLAAAVLFSSGLWRPDSASFVVMRTADEAYSPMALVAAALFSSGLWRPDSASFVAMRTDGSCKMIFQRGDMSRQSTFHVGTIRSVVMPQTGSSCKKYHGAGYVRICLQLRWWAGSATRQGSGDHKWPHLLPKALPSSGRTRRKIGGLPPYCIIHRQSPHARA